MLSTISAIRCYQNNTSGCHFLCTFGFFYSIDYLIKPQGKLMEHIRDVHETFFSVNTMDVYKRMMLYFKPSRDKDIDFDSFKRELYETYVDFDQVNSFEPYSIQDVVKAQIKDLEWYKNNGYDIVSASICGFIIGYSFYTLSLTIITEIIATHFYMVRYTHFFVNWDIIHRHTSTKEISLNWENKKFI